MTEMLPLFFCLACCLLAAGSLGLCFRLRAELRRAKLGSITHAALAAALIPLTERLNTLYSRVQDCEGGRNEDAEWLAQAESLNLNRRGQVLRLHQRGESVSGIASALRMEQGEVILTIKVYEIGRDTPPREY